MSTVAIASITATVPKTTNAVPATRQNRSAIGAQRGSEQPNPRAYARPRLLGGDHLSSTPGPVAR